MSEKSIMYKAEKYVLKFQVSYTSFPIVFNLSESALKKVMILV